MSIPTKPYPLQSGKAERYAQLRQELSDWVQKGMKRHKVTGMSIVLLDDGEVVWGEGFGWADKTNKRLADVETLYKAGSISKVFTATAIMQLVEQGKVDLDAPIQTYIPELKPKYHFEVNTPVTLRQIMSHRSGLTGDRLEGMFTRQPKRFDTVIEHLNRVHHPYAPDTVPAYSNLATDLQGVVIKRVSGERFEDYIERHILQPLGMVHSTFSDQRVDGALASKAYRHHKEDRELPLRDLPAGNLHTSALELSRFADMVLKQGGAVLQTNTLNAMFKPQAGGNTLHDMGMEFGLNWAIERPSVKHLGQVVWHTGGTIHFMSAMVILPKLGLSVVVLSNSAQSITFVEETADKILSRSAYIKHGIEEPAAPDLPPETPMPGALLQSLPGHYATVAGAVKFYSKGDTVRGNFMGLTLKLQHHEDGWISLHPRLFGFIPLPLKGFQNFRIRPIDGKGERLLVADYKGSIIPAGVKVEPYEIPEQWRNFIGKYRVKLPEGDYEWLRDMRLIERDGYLFISLKIQNQGPGLLIIKPISNSIGIGEGYGRGAKESIYLEQTDEGVVMHSGGCRFVREQ